MAQGKSQRGTLIAVAAIIAGGVVAGIVMGRGGDALVSVPTAPSLTPAGTTPTSAASVGKSAAHETSVATAPAAPAVAALSEAELARLAEESMAGPPAMRIAAIENLAHAPRDQALPLLKRVLLNGDPAVDRPAALQGLRELALAQGDADGHIRDAVREVIYHGDDEKLAADAQDALDVIAESELPMPRDRRTP
jgi:hypothetical protein